MLNVYGPTPPLAFSDELYGIPTVPPGGFAVMVRDEVAVAEVMVTDCWLLTVYGTSLESVSCAANVNVPLVVGVPLI
jgi:hypothetical protein